MRQIVVLDDLVAVVGDHMWAAKCGLEALDITWNEGPNAEVSSDLIWSRLRSASLRDGAVAKEVGDVKKALGAERRGVRTRSSPPPMRCRCWRTLAWSP